MKRGEFNLEFPRRSYTVLDCLPFLTREPFNALALAYIWSLRPSIVRVIEEGGETKCDACPWRVTVYLTGDKIESISQEVEVGLPDGIKHGGELDHLFALQKIK